MKFVVVLFLFGMVGLMNACSVSQTIVVQHEKLTGVWYEKLALGDSWMTFFNKCMKNAIKVETTGAVTKTRSYVWKWFPWITWNSESSLNDRGAKWEITESGFLGIGHKTKDLSILALESEFIIVKTCPNEWLASGDRVWVYWKTNAEVGKDQLAKVQQALDKAGGNYKVENFKVVSQSNC